MRLGYITIGAILGKIDGGLFIASYLIAAMCIGMPVVALPSNTPKIEGMLRDVGIFEYAMLNETWLERGHWRQLKIIEDSLARWDQSQFDLVANYVAIAREKIAKMFIDISTLPSIHLDH